MLYLLEKHLLKLYSLTKKLNQRFKKFGYFYTDKVLQNNGNRVIILL